MKKTQALLGSAIFFIIAPGTVAGLGPWLVDHWQVYAPFFGLEITRWIGLAVTALGLAGLIDSFLRFAIQGIGTPAPIAPTEHLVITGLYRYVRNPMYVCVLSLIIGQALLRGSVFTLAYGGIIWIAFHVFVCFYEEPTLRKTFAQEYAAYCKKVPRWIPRPPTAEGAKAQP
jgi:protein-S-isoprenylcysteine O-methyltransferase Ste14